MTKSMVFYETGQLVPFHLSGGIVAASYFVSFAGAVTSVELLHRRIYVRGWPKWLELFSCALIFALVSIWCMHYVGNRAIILGIGEADLQLVYNSGYTALSAFLPIVAMVAAFTVADSRHRGRKRFVASLMLSGIIAGAAVVAMHYTGNLGIANYYVELDRRYIGGAVIIACTICITALTLIFVLQDRWISILPYRLCAAALLAGGVSSMHFVATMGTAYRLKYRLTTESNRLTNLILAVVFSLLTIPICIGVSWRNAQRQKLLADRAQQVFLACARFDEDGRVMVTTEGLLPSQKITTREKQRSFDDRFNVNHPVFQWCFRVSYDWSCVIKWLPNMNRHLRAVNFIADSQRSGLQSRRSSVSWELTPESEDYSLIFRQSFCVAAAKLAADLKEVVCDVGTLYDGVMTTGTVLSKISRGRHPILGYPTDRPVDAVDDVEASAAYEVLGRGQLLFLVQQCDNRSAARLVGEGYRFVSPTTAVKHMAKSMQVPQIYLCDYLKTLSQHARAEHNPDPPMGTLLGLFVLRAGIQKRSFEVLTRKDLRFQLPCVQFSQSPLDIEKLKLLTELENISLAACLSRLSCMVNETQNPNVEFWKHLHTKILALQEVVNEGWVQNAVFSSKVITVQTSRSNVGPPSCYSLIVFHIVPDVHAASLKFSAGLTYTPFSFFKCRQQIFEGPRCRASFDRRVHQEFASLFAAKDVVTSTRKPHKSLQPHFPFKWAEVVRSNSTTSSVASLWTLHLAGRESTLLGHAESDSISMQPNIPFGGIMVSSDVTVEPTTGLDPKQPAETVVHVEKDTLTTSAYAGAGDPTTSTYVDELYALAVAKWSRRKL